MTRRNYSPDLAMYVALSKVILHGSRTKKIPRGGVRYTFVRNSGGEVVTGPCRQLYSHIWHMHSTICASVTCVYGVVPATSHRFDGAGVKVTACHAYMPRAWPRVPLDLALKT